MQTLFDRFNSGISAINSILWHPAILYILLATGLLYSVWSRFSQWRSITHGAAVVAGRYDDAEDPGAISHFQALSAALSATVGLGNIGGVGLGLAIGGPGAVFWMWIVGLLGMALKTTEVTLSMLYRVTDDPENPHGGPMWVVSRGLAARSPRWAKAGRLGGGFFCVTLLVSTATGGNFFQAWNVGNITQQYFGIPALWAGVVLAILVGLVILGGIQRIGAVAGRLVPLMCGAYLVACIAILILRIEQIPGVLELIFRSAFSGTEAQGAFVGGTVGFAFATGLQRAFFSNEAGQGSSPIAHAAAKTSEPAREGLVAGLEPFVDTLVVCTMTAMVIFLSGAWNRQAELHFLEAPSLVQTQDGAWSLHGGLLPERPDRTWQVGDTVQVHLELGATRQITTGTVVGLDPSPSWDWSRVLFDTDSAGDSQAPGADGLGGQEPVQLRPARLEGIYIGYTAAGFTAHAFDLIQPGLGKWLVSIASWMFALSTLISWSYYGEQGVIYLAGERWTRAYRLVFCLLIVASCSGLVRSTAEINNLSLLGTGCMLWANVPILLFFGREAIQAQADYLRRMSSRQTPGSESR